jgi:ribonuclease G
MSKELIVSSTSLETKVAILDNNVVTELFIERTKNKGILGNIYKGKVTKVLPGMQAAFVDIGLERHAFLYVGDFLTDAQEDSEIFEDDRKKGRVPSAHTKKAARWGAKSKDLQHRGEEIDSDLEGFPSIPKSTEKGGLLPVSLGSIRTPSELKPRPSKTSAGLSILPQRLKVGKSNKAKGPVRTARRKSASTESRNSRPLHFSANGSKRNSRAANGQQVPIDQLLKQGQEILVQVSKEPIGRKGARITSHIALPGRFLVFMPTVGHVGVSRKIATDKERLRLKELVFKLRTSNSQGFIVRTAGAGKTEEAISADIEYLTQLWSKVRERLETAKGPSLVHEEPGVVERTVRDYLSDDFQAILVDDNKKYAQVIEFVGSLNPDLVPRIRLYSKSEPILDAYGINSEIEQALQSKVWLENGGYLVINETEALVAIDVNTGKFVGNTNSLEDTITATNVYAAKEIVRQLRLRDLGGIIILDFIDMEETRNQGRVLDTLQKALATDKAPSKTLRFNDFGLVALTRKRAKRSLGKSLSQACAYCEGRGRTRSPQTISYAIHDEVRKNVKELKSGSELLIRCHPSVADIFRDKERDIIEEIGGMTQGVVTVQADDTLHVEKYTLSES